MDPPPSVSAVITCFNERDVIDQAVRSALDQDCDAVVEVVVVDDGSTDGSGELLATSFAGDPRLRIVRQDNSGLAAARNRGIAETTGEWVALLDGDDIWEHDRIRTALDRIERDPSVGLVYSDFVLFTDTATRRVRANDIGGKGVEAVRDLLTRGGPIAPSTTTLRRALVTELGGFDETLPSAEDTDMWLRMLDRAPAARIARPLVRKRDHPRSLGKQRALKVASMERVVTKAVAAHPELADAGRRRLARSRSTCARQAARAGELREALSSAMAALRDDVTASTAWTALGQSMVIGAWAAVSRRVGRAPTAAAGR